MPNDHADISEEALRQTIAKLKSGLGDRSDYADWVSRLVSGLRRVEKADRKERAALDFHCFT